MPVFWLAAGGGGRKSAVGLRILPAVVAEASDRGADQCVSHHPVIFHPWTLPADSPVYLLAQKGCGNLRPYQPRNGLLGA